MMGVLGPLMLAGGTRHIPGASKPRQLLALLLLNANQMVSGADCVREIWGSNPPKSAVSTLQGYVVQIRRVLRAISENGLTDSRAVLVTRNQSYQLAVSGDFDLFLFEQRARQARAAVARGEDHLAAQIFRSALRLWRGPALADVPAGPLISMHRVAIEESRRAVLEQRIETDLRLGRHRRLIDELDGMVKLNPTNENVHAQYMIALYRSGMRAHALQVFDRLCHVLDEDLGIEPSPRMRRLHQAIRGADPVLDGRTASAS